MRAFTARIEIIGVNPYVLLPPAQLARLFSAAGRSSGPIPIAVRIGRVSFEQTLVKYQGAYRLYLNTPMRRVADKDVGQRITLAVAFDPAPRREPLPAALARALRADRSAGSAFAALAPSRQKEIARYLNALKSREARERNLAQVLAKLRGQPAAAAFLRERKLKAPRRKR